MKDLSNKTVLITGGASGIGKIMTRLMLERKAQVIIWDINQKGIDEVLREFASIGTISGYCVDVSDKEAIRSTAQKVKSFSGPVDVLINNAGIIVGKYFHEHAPADIQRTMDINASAPMYITLEFIQDMIARKSGHICNIASSGGIVSNPKMSVYAASKWSVIGWSDSVRLEMEQLGTRVGVTTVMPYYINTGMFDGVRSRIPILDPEKAALKIVRSIEKNRRMVTLPGYIYRLTRLVQAVLPLRMYDWVLGEVFGIYKTMAHFTGRQSD